MDASTPERVRLSVPLPCLRRGLGLPLALEPGLERYAFAGASLQPRADSRSRCMSAWKSRFGEPRE